MTPPLYSDLLAYSTRNPRSVFVFYAQPCRMTSSSAVADKPARRAAQRQTVTWPKPRPFRGWYVAFLVTSDIAYLCKKFDDSSFSYSWGMFRAWNLKWITWRDHTHFRNSLSFVGSLIKSLRLSATKGNAKCRILVLSHPLGDLKVKHRVHLWLDWKRIVDFLLGIINLFR